MGKMLQSLQEMRGKTIQSVDDTAQNVLKLRFTDDTSIDVWAECPTYGISYFVVHPEVTTPGFRELRMVENKTLHELLCDLKQNIAQNDPTVRHDMGLCGNFGIVSMRNTPTGFRQFFNDAVRRWPEFSGCEMRPVYVGNKDAAPLQYLNAVSSRSMFAGEYGAARLRLLDYLITASAPKNPTHQGRLMDYVIKQVQCAPGSNLIIKTLLVVDCEGHSWRNVHSVCKHMNDAENKADVKWVVSSKSLE